METETFLFLTGIGWAAVSSVATLLAVIVALFLPFFTECIKKRNILKIADIQIQENYQLLLKANELQASSINGETISRVNMMSAVLRNIDNSFWYENKQKVAEISSKKYIEYNRIENILLSIKKHTDEINSSQGISACVGFIEEEVRDGIQIIEKWITDR